MRFVIPTVRGRLFRTFAAHGLNQVVNLLSQILTLPLLIGVWSTAVYRDWLLIIAVPAFFTLADLGFGQAVASEVGKLWAAGQNDEASNIYQTGLTVVVVSCIVCAAVFIPLIFFTPIQHMLNVTVFSGTLTRELVAIFTMQVLVFQVLGVLRSGFRAHGLDSMSIALSSLVSIGGLLAVIITSLVHGTPMGLASMILGTAVLVTIIIYVEERRCVPWLIPRFRPVKWATLKLILAPGLGMNLISLATGLSLQGTFLAVSNAISPQLGMIFWQTRVLTRSVNQVTNMVSFSFTAEFSTALGASNYDLAKRLHHRSSQVSFWAGVLSSVAVAIVAKPVFGVWTRHNHDLPFMPVLFGLLLVALVVNGAYWGSIMAPTAVNKHLKMSIAFCVASAVSVGVCWVCAYYFGLAGAGIGVISLEVIMTVIVVPIAIRIVHDDFGEWLRAMLSPDFRWLIRRVRETH